MENAEKRFRAPNYSVAEGLHLCSIIEKYKKSIENKATDGDSLKEKQKAWSCVAKEYNSTTPSYSRTVESLQNCYKKLKQKAKKKNSDAKMQIVKKDEPVTEMQVHGENNGDTITTELKTPKTVCETILSLVEDAKMGDSVVKKRLTGIVGETPSYHGDSNVLLNKVKSLISDFIEGMYCAFAGDAEIMGECKTSQDSLKIIPSAAAVELTNNLRSDTNESTAEDIINKDTDLPTTSYTPLTNNGENVKRKKDIAPALTHNFDTPNKKIKRDTILEIDSHLINENAELVSIQKEILSMQLKEENYKMEHNKLLRELELEAIKKKYEQEEQMREEQLKLIKLDVLLKEKQLNN